MRNAKPIPAAPSTDTDVSVICRPGKETGASIGVSASFTPLFAVGAATFLTVPGPGTGAVSCVFAVLSLLSLFGLVSAIVWARRGAIIADRTGLRWRGLGGWKSARWDEVNDYYVRLSPQNRGGLITYRTLETAAGRLNITSQWTNIDALCVCVELRATASAVRDWGVLGTRPCDPWPRTFRYDTWQNIWTPRLLIKLMGFALTFLFVKPLTEAAALAGFVSWPMKLGLFAPSLLMAFMVLLMPLVLLSQYRATGRRKAERITADLNGIVFEDKARHVEAAWSQVTAYQIAAGPGAVTICCRVETRQGDFDFLSTLSEFFLLKEIVRRYAKDAADTDWKHRDSLETLGGERACWSGAEVGVGARVFHYRTRSHRALPWGSAALLLSLCAVVPASMISSPGSPPPPFLLTALFAAVLVTVLLYGWRVYRHCGVHLDEDGLTLWTPLGQTRIVWARVRDFYLGSDGIGVVESRDGKRIRFSSLIVRREELMAEVASRAAHCGRVAWEPKAVCLTGATPTAYTEAENNSGKQ